MGQVQALTGEGRISGVVLMALPIALFFAVYYLNPTYIMLLFTEELGRKMIAVARMVLQDSRARSRSRKSSTSKI